MAFFVHLEKTASFCSYVHVEAPHTQYMAALFSILPLTFTDVFHLRLLMWKEDVPAKTGIIFFQYLLKKLKPSENFQKLWDIY